MRLPLALLVLSTVLTPLAARAQSCSEESVSDSHLKARCGAGNEPEACQTFVASVLKNCQNDLTKAADRYIGFKKTPPPLSEADQKSMDEAHHEMVDATLLMQDLSANVINGAKHGALPAVGDPDQLENKYFQPSAASAQDVLNAANKATPPSTPQKKPDETAPQKTANDNDLPTTGAKYVESLPTQDPEQRKKNLASAGNGYLAGGDAADAARVGAALSKMDPGDSAGWSIQSRAALSEGKAAQAAEFAKKALQLDPSDTEAKKALAFAESILSKDRLRGPGAKPDFGGGGDAGGLGGAGNFGGAGGPGGASRVGTVPPPATPLGAAPGAQNVPPVPPFLQNALHKWRVGDKEGALSDLTLALDQDPDNVLARIWRSELDLDMSNPQAALADADRALTKEPNNPRALRAKAAALLALGRLEEALPVIELALRLEPGAAAGHLIYAQVLEKLGRVDDAVAQLKEAARLDPALTPVVDAMLKKLGRDGKPAPAGVSRGLLRGGFITLSLVLVLLGTLGGLAARTLRSRPASQAPLRDDPERTLGPGEIVGRQYRITRELGRGGMGVVFEAVDETLKRPVALKQLQADLRLSDEDAARFLQEARLVAQLKHPHIAEIHAAVDDGGLFLVFELIEGTSLDKALSSSGPMPADEVRRLVAELCSALTVAHDRRIVHRDLKPSNIMLDRTGRSKIMDFGIAHQGRGEGATKTSASGTPPYMAPEQAAGSVLPASDLYALAVMTYELLCGKRPFLGPDFLGPKLRGEFLPVSRQRAGLPPQIDGFFSSALSPDPSRRPKDAAAFRRAFDACWDATLPKTVA